MRIFKLSSYGRLLGQFSTLEKAKEAAQSKLTQDGYEGDDYEWHDTEYRSVCYSNWYIDQPENDVYTIEQADVK